VLQILSPGANLRLLNLQLQRQRCSRLESFYGGENSFLFLKTRYAINCVANFYNVGVVTRGSGFSVVRFEKDLMILSEYSACNEGLSSSVDTLNGEKMSQSSFHPIPNLFPDTLEQSCTVAILGNLVPNL
jgi:hypothetical protein